MDPLSITTGIVTLIGVTNSIISTCYDFKAALKDIPWSLTRIIEESKCLRSILEHLEDISHHTDRDSKGKRPMFEILSNKDSGPLIVCSRELCDLDKIIRPSSCIATPPSKRKATLQALLWQFKDVDAKKCLDRIERCKSALSLALAVDEATSIGRIYEMTTSLQATVRNTNHEATIIADGVRSAENRAILHWLSPVDPYENHEAASAAHQQGTGAWIIESKRFLEWYEANISFLWLSGFPGSGKTILLYDSLIQSSNNVELTSIAKVRILLTISNGVPAMLVIAPVWHISIVTLLAQNFKIPKNIVGSLVAQLCSKSKFPMELVTAFKNSQISGQMRRPTWEVLRKTMFQLCQARKIFILVDALDECDNRNELLDFMAMLQDDKGNINVLVTSRDVPDIADTLGKLNSRVRMESQRVEVDIDINSYINYRLENELKFRCLSTLVRSEIKKCLYEKCEGMFRWAQCQLDAISELRTTKAIRTSLKRLPKGLEETYENILKRTNEDDIDLLRKILLWVIFSVLPLTIKELCEALAIESGTSQLSEIEECRLNDPKDILRLGKGLIVISASGHVKLAHLSVKDYLLSTTIRETSSICEFGMRPGEENRRLALDCIAYLSLDSLASGPTSESGDWNSRLEHHPLLKHATKAWPYYFRTADMSDELEDRVSRFFKPESQNAFMAWVQVLNSNWMFEWNNYPRGATSLYYAASFGLRYIVADLVREGVILDAAGSRFGGTALHGAAVREHVEIVRDLLQAGASPSQADFNLVTPLHSAVHTGNVELIKLLLKFGASKLSMDNFGETPYDWAIKAGQTNSQKLLDGDDVPSPEGSVSTQRHQIEVHRRPTASCCGSRLVFRKCSFESCALNVKKGHE